MSNDGEMKSPYPPQRSMGTLPPAYEQGNYGINNQGYVSQGSSTNTTYPPTVAVSIEEPQQAPAYQFGSTFSEKSIRLAFIRKVYLILTAQLLVTFGIVAVFTFVQPLKQFITTTQTGWILYLVAYGTFVVLYIILVCIRSVARSWPGNVICLSVLTLALSFMMGMIACYHDTSSVVMAFGITMGVCIGVTLFSIQTKYDFTTCSGLLFCLCMALFWFGVACLVAHLVQFPMMSAVWGGLGAAVFSLFLAFDTQLVMGNKKYAITPEEYVYAALQLYIDVIQIFLYILAATGGGKK